MGEFSIHKRLPFNELKEEEQDKGIARNSACGKRDENLFSCSAPRAQTYIGWLSIPRGKQIKSATTKHFCVHT